MRASSRRSGRSTRRPDFSPPPCYDRRSARSGGPYSFKPARRSELTPSPSFGPCGPPHRRVGGLATGSGEKSGLGWSKDAAERRSDLVQGMGAIPPPDGGHEGQLTGRYDQRRIRLVEEAPIATTATAIMRSMSVIPLDR
jgi:hypothetical protein